MYPDEFFIQFNFFLQLEASKTLRGRFSVGFLEYPLIVRSGAIRISTSIILYNFSKKVEKRGKQSDKAQVFWEMECQVKN